MQLLENKVTAQLRRAFTTPTGRGEEGSTWRMEGQEELCTWSQAEHRADGLAHASQVVADPALEAQGSTGAFQEWKRSRGQDFSQSHQ